MTVKGGGPALSMIRKALPLEALAKRFVPRELRWKDFDRDRTVSPCVAGFVNLTHAAFANGGDDFVAAELGSGFQSWVSSRSRISDADERR